MIKFLPVGVFLILGTHVMGDTSYRAKLGENPVLSGGSYTSGGGLTVALDIRAIDGRTIVCGVWAESRHQSIFTKNEARGLLPASSVDLGKKRLVKNLAFLRKVEPMKDYAGQDANCVITNMAWVPGYESLAPTIRIPRRMIYFDGGGGGDGGNKVYFKQTGPGAGE